MPTKTFLAVLATLLTACLDQVDPTTETAEPPPMADHVTANASEASLPKTTTVIRPINRAESVCDMLPADGPCSVACDPQAMTDEYVPPGTCATFACQLTDGQFIRVGGCRMGSDEPSTLRRM